MTSHSLVSKLLLIVSGILLLLIVGSIILWLWINYGSPISFGHIYFGVLAINFIFLAKKLSFISVLSQKSFWIHLMLIFMIYGVLAFLTRNVVALTLFDSFIAYLSHLLMLGVGPVVISIHTHIAPQKMKTLFFSYGIFMILTLLTYALFPKIEKVLLLNALNDIQEHISAGKFPESRPDSLNVVIADTFLCTNLEYTITMGGDVYVSCYPKFCAQFSESEKSENVTEVPSCMVMTGW